MHNPAQPDLSGLAALAHDERLDVRPILLRVQTDLFVTAPARDLPAIEAFRVLAEGFLPGTDDLTAARVARKLAPCPDTPPSVMALLKARGGEARLAVAALGPDLDPELVEAALGGDLDLAEALAGRPDLDPRTIEHLAGLADPGVDFALAMNARIVLPDAAAEALVARAREGAALAQALLSRGDLALADEAALYCHADPARRERTRALVGAAARRGLALPRADESDALALLGLAEARNGPAFEQHLAAILGLEGAPDWRFAAPQRQELLALALLAAGVPSDVAIRIFILLDERIGRSVDAVFALAAIARGVRRETAAAIVEAVVGRRLRPSRPGRHQPAMDPSGALERPGSSSAERRSPADLVRRAAEGGSRG